MPKLVALVRCNSVQKVILFVIINRPKKSLHKNTKFGKIAKKVYKKYKTAESPITESPITKLEK